MAEFKYKAEDPFGEVVTGTYDALREEEVHVFLNRSNLRPIEVKKNWLKADLPIGNQVKVKDLVIFTRMFASLSKAAVPIDQAMSVLYQQTEHPKLKAAIQQVIVDIESGSNLADAMREHDDVFPPLFCNMIEAGEVSGNLDLLLDRLAEMLERNEEIRSKVKGALTYPAILFVVAILVVAVMLVWVIPQFVAVFRDAGVALPLPTRISIGVSQFLQTKWWVLLIGLGAGGLGLRYAKDMEEIREAWDKLSLKLPILGEVVQKGAIARFARTLSTVLGSGVGILDGLDLTAETTSNRVVSEGIYEAHGAIQRGEELAPPLQRTQLFPPLVTSMIAIGEESGNMEEMLSKVADFYEADVAKTVDRALALIEPIMLVFFGALVAMIMLSIYLPMFDMISAIGGG